VLKGIITLDLEFVWWMVPLPTKDVWSCGWEDAGILFVMTCGTSTMEVLCVDHWDTLGPVLYLTTPTMVKGKATLSWIMLIALETRPTLPIVNTMVCFRKTVATVKMLVLCVSKKEMSDWLMG
jgi:hypothetical protein